MQSVRDEIDELVDWQMSKPKRHFAAMLPIFNEIPIPQWENEN